MLWVTFGQIATVFGIGFIVGAAVGITLLLKVKKEDDK